MNAISLLVVLAIGWIVATGHFTLPNLVLGAAVAGLVLVVFRERLARPPRFSRFLPVAALALVFVRELLLSALGVARLVLTPNLQRHLRPAIVAFPLTARGDGEITLLANLITLTPGTLSVDVSRDGRHLFIHVLSLRSREALIREIQRGFERRVMDVFR